MKNWRDQIDTIIKGLMESNGFQLAGGYFTYSREMSPEIDFVVELKQERRWSTVRETRLVPGIGIVHKGMAELKAVSCFPERLKTSPPHWFYTNQESLIYHHILTANDDAWFLTEGMNQDSVKLIVEDCISAIEDFEAILSKQYGSLEAITADLYIPLKWTCPSVSFMLPVALVLAGRFDEAEHELEKYYQKLAAENGLRTGKTFVAFRKNLLIEIEKQRQTIL